MNKKVFQFNDNEYEKLVALDDKGEKVKDMVNHPDHYTSGRVEAIEVIEDAICHAPTSISGFYQAQVLKYMLRMWHKKNSKEDAQKARWYLNKLIDSLD